MIREFFPVIYTKDLQFRTALVIKEQGKFACAWYRVIHGVEYKLDGNYSKEEFNYLQESLSVNPKNTYFAVRPIEKWHETLEEALPLI